MLAPQHARELLSILVASGALRELSAEEPSGQPPSVLAACFGDAAVGVAHLRRQRFYFAQPGASFSGRRVLPPQVLLPLGAA